MVLWNWGLVWGFDPFLLPQNMYFVGFSFLYIKIFLIKKKTLALFKGGQNQSFQSKTLSFKQEASQYFK